MNSQSSFLKLLKRNDREKKTRVNVVASVDIIIDASLLVFR